MTLSLGCRIGPYEITGLLGTGGMGEVYRARDTKLGREVAIKVLPEAFANDPERMARFDREARVLASLNHPNIAEIYGVEERALVMELVEGVTLSDRVGTGPIPLDEALSIASQISQAMDYAHEKGIVHRDLKPANIKITRKGQVKVLDFGLAKALSHDAAGDDPTSSPTLTMRATDLGMILGTPAYMAPEQARGNDVDKRADIWSFGVVLYEMLTGGPLFAARTVSDTLAAVLTKEPQWDLLPAQVRDVLRRCLEKEPERRLHDIADVRLLLEDPPESGALPMAPPRPSARRGWLFAGLMTAVALALGAAHLMQRPQAARVVQFQIPPLNNARIDQFALSPDGSRLVFVSGEPPRLWIRALNSLEVKPLAGTEHSGYPFWAPTSDWIAYFQGGRLHKVALSGGPSQPIADAPNPRGGAWGPNDVIVFAPDRTGPLYRVPAEGGLSTPWSRLDKTVGEDSHRWPCFLPGGKVLYMRRSTTKGSSIWWGSLDGAEGKRLVEAESNVGFGPKGHSKIGYLLYVHESALTARLLNVQRGEFERGPVVVAERIIADSNSPHYAFSASEAGSLAYQSGSIFIRSRLTWVDRQGRQIRTLGAPAFFRSLSLSPDGKTVIGVKAETEGAGVSYDLWLLDSAADYATRFTSDGHPKIYPVWSPDGSRIAFSVIHKEMMSRVSKAFNGTGPEELLPAPPQPSVVTDWSSNGQLLFSDETFDTSCDLWRAEAKAGAKPVRYIQRPRQQMTGRFSPDSKWVAYVSNETGRFEIYVQSFPSAEARWQVSTSGGKEPVWRRDGKELFYLAPDSRLMAVEVRAREARLEFSSPKQLFDSGLRYTPVSNDRSFDASADGERFLLNRPVGEEPPASVTMLLNWTATLAK